MNSWIKTTADFIPLEIPEEEWNCYSEEQKTANLEARLFRFDMKELFAYNESGQGMTALRFKSGYEIVVNIKIEKFDLLFDRIMNND